MRTTTDVMDPADETSSATSRVISLGDQRFAVQLQGALRPGWAGRLAGELADRRVSILRGWAHRTGAVQWEASFDLRPLDPGVDLFQLDLLALARGPSGDERRLSPPPRILGFHVERSGRELGVAVRAEDGVGFLDAMLGLFAFYGLFPREMTIETRDGEACDQFKLQGLAGRAPSLAMGATIQRALRQRVVSQLSATAQPLP